MFIVVVSNQKYFEYLKALGIYAKLLTEIVLIRHLHEKNYIDKPLFEIEIRLKWFKVVKIYLKVLD